MNIQIEKIKKESLENIEETLEELAVSLKDADLKIWMTNFYDAMNDRSYFTRLERGHDYSNPSRDTILRLKLYTLYEVLND